MTIVEVEAVVEQGVALIFLNAAGGDEEIGGAVAIHVEERGADIVGLGGGGPWLIR